MAEDSTQPPHATRFVETTRGILSYSQLAPLLAERVLRVLQDIEDGVFASRPLDESLLLDFHRNICGDLTPDWAGKFRATEVKVGQHSPPPSHQVPMLVRDYFADLNVRLADLSAGRETLLAEILRRQELPPVELAPADDTARKNYIQALEAANKLNWMPLIEFWQKRLENV